MLNELRRRDAATATRYYSPDPEVGTVQARLADAQYLIGREYGYKSWQKLKERLDSRAQSPSAVVPFVVSSILAPD